MIKPMTSGQTPDVAGGEPPEPDEWADEPPGGMVPGPVPPPTSPAAADPTLPPEAPEADALDQSRPVAEPVPSSPAAGIEDDRPQADVLDQLRAEPLDEDDDRR